LKGSIIKLKVLIAAAAGLFLLLAVAGPPLQPAARATGAATDSYFDTTGQVASSDSFTRLRAIASRAGSVRAMVELQMRLEPDDTLDAAGLSAQNAEIQRAGDAVLAALPADSYRVLHRYDALPFLALELTPTGLDTLQRAGLAADVHEDMAASPSLAPDDAVDRVDGGERVQPYG
jgi:hypothetical protein